MSETPNHEYNVPTEGDENWHQPLNANFEALEVDIELRDEGGPTEGTNDYDPTDGAKYLDTATGLVYLADGNTWTQTFDLSGSGGGGIQGLSGGDGINPDTIGDGDTLTAAWGDATSLDSNGDINDFSGATDLDSAGTVSQLSGSVAGGQTLTNIAGTNLNIDSNGQLNASGGSGGIQGLSGGDGINPDTIGDGDTLTVAWGDATDLGSGGAVDQLSGSVAGGQTLTDIAGNNLSIDSNGTLNASGGGGGGINGLSGGEGINPSSITDGDTLTVAWTDADGLNSNGVPDDFRLADDLNSAGSVVDFSSAASLDSSGTVDAGRYMTTSGGQVDFAGPAEWSNAGSTGTNTVSGGAATVAGGESNEASNLNATVAGGKNNTASGVNTTISGGEDNEATNGSGTIGGGTGNKTTAGNTVVGGGSGNESRTNGSTVGGGAVNIADAEYATVAGGNNNLVTGDYGTIAGGAPLNPPNDNTQNAVYDAYGTIGGGSNNQAGSDDGTANAEYATVPGGRNNTASGAYSTAMGRNATANNDGSFVVGDATSNLVTSQNDNEARFQGEVVSESFFETDGSYAFNESGMFLNTFEDNNTGNDVFAISTVGLYGSFITQMRVNEFGDVVVTGDFDVEGNKNFVEPVETDDGEKEVVYTASEAAEPRTEASGVANVEDGRAVIELPDHFGWVTSDDEPLVVQTTPYADEPVQPQVTERSTDRIVIEDFAGVDEYEVAYTVKGTRVGQEDKQVVREPTATGPSPAPADDD